MRCQYVSYASTGPVGHACDMLIRRVPASFETQDAARQRAKEPEVEGE
jgi:hypothetical protein